MTDEDLDFFLSPDWVKNITQRPVFWSQQGAHMNDAPDPRFLPLIQRIEALRDAIKVMMIEIKELNFPEADTAYMIGEMALKQDEEAGKPN